MVPALVATTAQVPAYDDYRLPRTVEPVTYRLLLTPDVEAGAFSGTVDIDVVVHEQVDEIVLNASELSIDDATVKWNGHEPVRVEVSLDERTERARLGLPAPLMAGDATVSFTFRGRLNDQIRGFYRSTFTNSEGAVRSICTTQMFLSNARRTFPCWDEPDRKAIFEITLVVDEDLVAVSNAPVAAEEPIVTQDGKTKRRVRFAPTIKMSTYLVAFVIGPLEITEPVDAGGVPVRVVHVPGKGHLADYALEVARHGLRFFTDYFGIAYPGDKLDLVGVPDFPGGGAENPGCVTFHEVALLVDPATASQIELERVANVVHHEIAHMWFGDLVTMEWWDGTWLNEAFATFMEMLATDHYRPTWQRWAMFGVDRDVALAVDGLHTTRPIEYHVESPNDALGMFDVLTYQKGASVLRMIEQYLGSETFRRGVRRYLESNAFANTSSDNLWEALEEASDEPVRAIAESWVLQGGFPLVRVGGSTIRQEPFSYLPEPRSGGSAVGDSWLVPLLVRDVGPVGTMGATRRLLLDDQPAALEPAEGSLFFANAGGCAPYRVSYPSDHLQLLGERLATLVPVERVDLFSDTWALVLSGKADLGDLLGLAARLGDEDEPGVYRTVVAVMDLCARVAPDHVCPTVSAATGTLFGGRLAALGWDASPGEGERVPTTRSLLIAALGTIGKEQGVREEAVRRFDAAQSGSLRIDPNVEGAVLAVVSDLDRAADYETIVSRYRHPATPQEERRYLGALSAFPDVERCLQSFELALDGARIADGAQIVRSLLANRVAGPAVWERVKAEWPKLLERLPENHHASMVSTVPMLCIDHALAEDVDRFLTEHPVQAGQRTVGQTLEQLAVNVRWADRLREPGLLERALARVHSG